MVYTRPHDQAVAAFGPAGTVAGSEPRNASVETVTLLAPRVSIEGMLVSQVVRLDLEFSTDGRMG